MKQASEQEISKSKKKEEKKLKSDVIFLLSIFILKTLSSKTKPLKTKDIVDKFPISGKGESLAGDADGRRLGERLVKLAESQAKGCDPLSLVFGGYIRVVYSGREAEKAPQKMKQKGNKSFYFEPLLSEGDMIFLRGHILSDKKLLSDEKDFVIERLMTLYPGLHPYLNPSSTHSEEDISILSQKLFHSINRPKSNQDTRASDTEVTYLDYLKNIQILYSAIKNAIKIKIVHGRYLNNPNRPSEAIFCITKDSKAADDRPKEYIVNPYDLVWNNGNYYLVATLDEKEVFRTFRVDRIKQILPLFKKDEEGNEIEREYERREDLPQKYKHLKRNVSHSKDSNFILDSDLFLKTYPLMITKTIHDKKEAYIHLDLKEEENANSELLPNATILCDQIGFSILVDHFSKKFWSKPLSKVDEKLIPPKILSQIKESGAIERYFLVTLHDVCFDGLVLFCLNFQASLTGSFPSLMALEPASLVESVQKRLLMSLEAYQNLK